MFAFFAAAAAASILSIHMQPFSGTIVSVGEERGTVVLTVRSTNGHVGHNRSFKTDLAWIGDVRAGEALPLLRRLKGKPAAGQCAEFTGGLQNDQQIHVCDLVVGGQNVSALLLQSGSALMLTSDSRSLHREHFQGSCPMLVSSVLEARRAGSGYWSPMHFGGREDLPFQRVDYNTGARDLSLPPRGYESGAQEAPDARCHAAEPAPGNAV